MPRKIKNNNYVKFIIKIIIFFIWIVFLLQKKIGLSITNGKNILNNKTTITKKNKNIETLSNIYKTQLKQGNLTIQQMKEMINKKINTYKYETSQLKEAWEKTKNKKILATLIQYLSDHFMFNDANYYLQQFNNDAHLFLPGKTILYIILNNNKLSYNNYKYIKQIKNSIILLEQKGYLNKDDKFFFMGLLQFLQYKFKNAIEQRENIKTTKYKDFIKNINNLHNLQKKQKDIPDYYYISLINLNIIKKGYFKISQQVAIQVLNKNGKYILPYQLLSYSHFIMGNREIASDYLNKLKKIDNENKNKYNFLLGISYFWQKRYLNSIIYLKQTFLPEYEIDKLRYLLLAYKNINDTNNFMITINKILGNKNIQAIDFYLFFERIFYYPIINIEKDYSLFNKHKTLSISYVKKCFNTLNTNELFICDYGQAGLLLAENKKKQAGYILKKIANKRHKSYIRNSLGDRYVIMGKNEEAKDAYIRSLSLPSTEKEKIYSKKRLENIIK